MELRHLRYFIAVAEELSFTRAARRLRISQPVLSRQVRDLEDELGVELLLRSTGSVSLSVAGALYLERARRILDEVVDAELALRDFVQDRAARIDVGYMPQVLDSFLSGTLGTYCQAHPEVAIQLHDLPPGRQVEELRKGRLDVALAGHVCPELEKEFDLFRIHKLPLCAVLPREHALAGRKTIRLAELAGDPFIRLAEDAFPGRAPLLRALCEKAGFKPKRGPEADSLGSLLALAASGRGVCLVPDEVEAIAPRNLVFVPFTPKAHVDFHAVVQRDERRPAVRVFLQECRRQAG